MKIIRLINQNIPIWSMLNGDHALKKSILKINPKLIKNPNFLDKLENKLRQEVFNRDRKWIVDNFGENPSFAIVEFSFNELMKFYTCFQGISFQSFVDEHIKSMSNSKHKFLIEKDGISLDKSKSYIKYMKTFKDKVLKSIKTINLNDIDNIKKLNDLNLWLAVNRGILIKNRDGKIKIIDATHRLTSYALLKKENKKNIPNKLYAFYCEK